MSLSHYSPLDKLYLKNTTVLSIPENITAFPGNITVIFMVLKEMRLEHNDNEVSSIASN